MAADKRTYLDTNVYNRIADAISLPVAHGQFESHWSSKIYLSPINILEILQIEDDYRRETIVRILQELCAPKLLAEPEALLVDFIAERTQLDAIGTLRLDSPFSVSVLGKAWKDIQSDPAKTFVFNDAARSRIRQLKLLNRLLHAWYRRGGSVEKGNTILLGDFRQLPVDQIESAMMRTMADMKSMPVTEPRPSPIYDLILVLTACVLIVGVTPFPEAVDKLWISLGIKSIDDRIRYVLQGPLKCVLSEGPIVGMAAILASQVAKRFNSGNLLDAYHASYMPYISELLTFDKGLLSHAAQFPRSQGFSKIQSAESLFHELFSKPSDG